MERINEPTATQLEFASLFPNLVLVSSSENRRAMLEASGIKVMVFPPDSEEIKSGENAAQITARNAMIKMDAYIKSGFFTSTIPALSADTLIEIGENVLGKASDENSARKILSLLSGTVHRVVSSSCLLIPGMKIMEISDSVPVKFRKLDKKEIDDYISTGEWVGAAASYRVQKTGYKLISKISGDWCTVVGLPLKKIIESYSICSS